MRRAPREQLILVAGILLIAAPFAFGFLRAFTTGTDWRYLWVAIVAFVGSSAIIAIGRSRSQTSSVTIGITAVALIGSTFAAVIGARFLAHTQSAATWIVSFAFAFCTTVGTVLWLASQPRRS
jgi:hypothetical protein